MPDNPPVPLRLTIDGLIESPPADRDEAFFVAYSLPAANDNGIGAVCRIIFPIFPDMS